MTAASAAGAGADAPKAVARFGPLELDNEALFARVSETWAADDSVPDTAHDLRSQIFALGFHRLFMSGVHEFLYTLTLPDGAASDLTFLRGLLDYFNQNTWRGLKRQRAWELSLLLRLLVVLGVDLNQRYTVDIERGGHEARAETTLMFHQLNNNPVMGFAVLAAGRRLRLDFRNYTVTYNNNMPTAVHALRACVLDTQSDFGVSEAKCMAQVGHVAGEAGVLYAPGFVPGTMRMTRPIRCPLFHTSENAMLNGMYNLHDVHVMLAEYARDDASPHRWPALLAAQVPSCPNKRRDAYRVGIPPLVAELLAVAPVVAIVLEYVWLPL